MAVKLPAEPLLQFYCHCDDCQAVRGAAFVPVAMFLLPAGRFTPTFHIHCRFALLPMRDDLPHYRSLPALLGGSDQTVDW